jgi:hypothetical protein
MEVGAARMNTDNVSALHELYRRLQQAIEATGDDDIRLAWMRIQTSEAWIATGGTDPFCELQMREALATLTVAAWDSPMRCKRILDFGRWATFL